MSSAEIAGHAAGVCALLVKSRNVTIAGLAGIAASGLPTSPHVWSSQTISLSSSPFSRNFTAVANSGAMLLVTRTRAPESFSLWVSAISPSSGLRCTIRAPAFSAPKKFTGWSGELPRNSATDEPAPYPARRNAAAATSTMS